MNLSDVNNLELEDIGAWPPIVKFLSIALLVTAVLAAGYFLDTKDMRERLAREEITEHKLVKDFTKRQRAVANLDAYRTQLVELEKNLASMLQQLPTKTEMPDLLDDISNTGLINGLVFERFKPEKEAPREFYAKQPISLRARGTYHQFGAFLSGVSALPRIVTVGGLKIDRGGKDRKQRGRLEDDQLFLEAKLSTYRYLDGEEEDSE